MTCTTPFEAFTSAVVTRAVLIRTVSPVTLTRTVDPARVSAELSFATFAAVNFRYHVVEKDTLELRGLLRQRR